MAILSQIPLIYLVKTADGRDICFVAETPSAALLTPVLLMGARQRCVLSGKTG